MAKSTKGACAITLDKDKAFISFARINKKQLSFVCEEEVDAPYKGKALMLYLQKNTELFNQKIKSIESKHNFTVEKVFFELPFNLCKIIKVEEIIPLKRKKRITFSDINFVKKYVESKFLDWDDLCIHDLVLSYEVEGQNYRKAPLGLWAKKIKLYSFLVGVKSKLYKDIEVFFDNMNRNFSGFVSPHLSIFSSSFTRREKIQIVVNINYDRTHIVANYNNSFSLVKELEWGLENLISRLAKRYILSTSLAEEVFQRYISFKRIPHFKEITLRKDDSHVKLSIRSLNTFIKDCLREELNLISQSIEEFCEDKNFVISFIGRFSHKEGFHNFIKEVIDNQSRAPFQRTVLSSSYGCLSYGLHPLLEITQREKKPLYRYILDVYSEYF